MEMKYFFSVMCCHVHLFSRFFREKKCGHHQTARARFQNGLHQAGPKNVRINSSSKFVAQTLSFIGYIRDCSVVLTHFVEALPVIKLCNKTVFIFIPPKSLVSFNSRNELDNLERNHYT